MSLISFGQHWCLSQLNHPISQALACGLRLASGEEKDLLLKFGLIHLFVISGAHLLFLESFLQKLKINKRLQLFLLFAFSWICLFSAPVLRSFVEKICAYLSITFKVHTHKELRIFLTAALCFIPAYYKGELFSLCLSLYFSLAVHFSLVQKKVELSMLILSFPLFGYLLGFPHISYPLVLLFAGFLVSNIFLPLALLSLLCETAEFILIRLYWTFTEALLYLDLFFNSPPAPKVEIKNFYLLGLQLILILFFLNRYFIKWKRKSLFLY